MYVEWAGPKEPDQLAIESVYMITAYSLYNASLERGVERALFRERYTIDYSDGSSVIRPTGHTALVSRVLREERGAYRIWWGQFLLAELEEYFSVIPTIWGYLTIRDERFGQQLFAGVEKMSQSIEEFRPFPNFDNIPVLFKPYARPVDFRATFDTALKVFKRVFVESGPRGIHLDQIIPQNRAFQAGNVEFTFLTLPGKPRLITWRDVARIAMAMIQFMKENGFREVRASVIRNGVVVGNAEVNVKPLTRSPGSQSANITVL